MEMPITLVFNLLFAFSGAFPVDVVVESHVTCADNNTACDVTEDNLVPNNVYCFMEVNGERVQSAMFTTVGETTASVTSQENCELRVVAIGGGGSNKGTNEGGSGSGYIRYFVQEILGNYNINIRVGGIGHSSTVNIHGPIDEDLIEANPGKNRYDGGDGYSGGGKDSCKCNGGTNGSDGQGNGGHGTGEDITSYKMDHFLLTPGAGGKYWMNSHGQYYGGGGGGVLVDGIGPHHDQYDGAGYGGGSGKGFGGGGGVQGAILLEVNIK